jgi:hypothetical protein
VASGYQYHCVRRAWQQKETQPLSNDQVLNEVAFLITVEHALIVEYLSVSCALGYDLAGADGGPADGPGPVAAAAKNQADFLMLWVAALARALPPSGERAASTAPSRSRTPAARRSPSSRCPDRCWTWPTGIGRSRPPWTPGTRG